MNHVEMWYEGFFQKVTELDQRLSYAQMFTTMLIITEKISLTLRLDYITHTPYIQNKLYYEKYERMREVQLLLSPF